MRPVRLVIALRAREEIPVALGTGLPGIGWSYLSELAASDRGSVEALLMGSVERDLGEFDVRLLPGLRFVQRLYTGVDGVPFERFPAAVNFSGNVGAYAPFVAEHAVALALSASRELPRALVMVKSGTLRPPPAQRLLWGQTAVILGYGEIGRAIAERLAGFGTRVIGLNRRGRMAPGVRGMFPAHRLIEAVRVGDYVFDVRPLTRSTEGTIDSAVLAAMKPTAVFVNVGRAGTVREEALYQHLVGHPEFRAALDVWWHEDFREGRIDLRFPFAELPNFVGTPHSAGFGPGVEGYVLDRAIANLRRYFSGETPRYLIDRSEYALAPVRP